MQIDAPIRSRELPVERHADLVQDANPQEELESHMDA